MGGSRASRTETRRDDKRRTRTGQSPATSVLHRARLLPRVLLAVPPLLLLLLLRLRLLGLLLNDRRRGLADRVQDAGAPLTLLVNSCHRRGGLRLRGLARPTGMVLEALVLATGQKGKSDRTMISGMLIVVS